MVICKYKAFVLDCSYNRKHNVMLVLYKSNVIVTLMQCYRNIKGKDIVILVEMLLKFYCYG